ncbi:outer membrane beta-barrel protein [Marinospirillum sp.]|uniref:outer membrane beta-barrel protein n=1 Tax=Marinospirillum sp. TaxID=2183934 RepID=UPI00384CA937
MKRWMASGLLTLAFFLPFATAQAFYDEYDDIYSYVSGGLHSWNSGEASAEGLKIRFGQQLSTFVGAEMHFALGGEDAEAEVSLDRLFGLYATFSVPLDSFRPYGKLGLGTASLSEAEETTSELEIGYGLGAAFFLTDQVFVDLEYMVYLETAEMELEGFTLGAGYKF